MFAAIYCSYIFVKTFIWKKVDRAHFQVARIPSCSFFSFLYSSFFSFFSYCFLINFLKQFFVEVYPPPFSKNEDITWFLILSWRTHLHFVIGRSLPLNYTQTSLATHLSMCSEKGTEWTGFSFKQKEKCNWWAPFRWLWGPWLC